MAICELHDLATSLTAVETWSEKGPDLDLDDHPANPVLKSARFVYSQTDLVKIDDKGVQAAAKHIYRSLVDEGYSPHTWRQHPLHLLPPLHYSPTNPRTKACLDWIFLVSSLNFSFWSDREGTGKEAQRFGVEWREGWGLPRKKVWTGYWSLVAAMNKAIETRIPITDPLFYASRISCPDSVIEDVFCPAALSAERVPLLTERIAVMREVGTTLVSKFGGSYAGLLSYFLAKYSGHGTALQLVQMIVEEFPPFRDEFVLNSQKVCFWKRAQILVAETWAAFYPPPDSIEPHPFFPYGIGQLTMFADYRVPQILHHLQIITYPPSLLSLLKSHTLLAPGSGPELSIRAASILAVEAVRSEILRLRDGVDSDAKRENSPQNDQEYPSVVIDFFLWDLAKKVEQGELRIERIETSEMVPAHRTRSIWY